MCVERERKCVVVVVGGWGRAGEGREGRVNPKQNRREASRGWLVENKSQIPTVLTLNSGNMMISYSACLLWLQG